MGNEHDMDAPVTRRELKEELEQFELRFARLEQRLEQRIEQGFAKQDERFQHYVNVVVENMRSQFGVLDDKYSSLPPRTQALEDTVGELSPRVTTLERKVFAPRKRRAVKRVTRRR
jgi:hypothetical protein